MRTTTAIALACFLGLGAVAPPAGADPVAPALRLLLDDPDARRAYGTPQEIRNAIADSTFVLSGEASGVIASPLLARRADTRLLHACLAAIETQEFGVPRIESMLDDANLDERTADAIAILTETQIPAIAARACVVAASAVLHEDPELARVFASAAVEYAEFADASVIDAALTHAHALRLLGRHDEALRAYADARSKRAATNDRGLIGLYNFEGETLIGAALSARGAGVVDDEGLLAMLDELWNERPFSMEPGNAIASSSVVAWRMRAADVAFESSRADGLLLTVHERVVRECYKDDRIDDRAWVHASASLAEAANLSGGTDMADVLPIPLLLGIARDEHAPPLDRRRAALFAHVRSADIERGREPLWADAALLYGTIGVVRNETDPQVRDAAVDALLSVLEDGALALAKNCRSALRHRLNVWDVPMPLRDRWLARARADLTGSDDRVGRTAVDALIEEQLRRVATWNGAEARDRLDEAQNAADRFGDIETRALLMRLHTWTLRLAELSPAERYTIATDALRISEQVGTEIAARGSGRSASISTSMWPLHAADALLVLNRPPDALTMLEVHDAPLLRTAPASGARARLIAHAQALLGNEIAAIEAFGPFMASVPASAFPGTPFVRDRESASTLARSFVGDAHEATDCDQLEAAYAVIDAGLAQRWGRGLDAEDVRRNAAHLIRVGRTEEALAQLDRFGDNESSTRLLRAEAHLRGGDELSAFAIYRELATALGTTASWRSTREHWHAWARMLEILDRQNGDGSRTQAVADSVRRLQALPSWGEHPDAIRRIEAIAG